MELAEEKMPSTKIVISQATNHKNDQNLNRKDNTVNSVMNELGHDSPRARNRFNQVVEAKRFEGAFLCRKVC